MKNNGESPRGKGKNFTLFFLLLGLIRSIARYYSTMTCHFGYKNLSCFKIIESVVSSMTRHHAITEKTKKKKLKRVKKKRKRRRKKAK